MFRSNKAKNDHLAFLPAAIEIEQTPASPVGRTIIWVIVSLFVIALLWATFGKVDIVAVAQGKVIPSERIKQVQPIETGKVTGIYVKDGQYVKAGEALITLDDAQAKADLERLSNELLNRKSELEGLRAYELWLEAQSTFFRGSKEILLAADEYISGLTQEQSLLSQQKISEVTSRSYSLINELLRLDAEQEMVNAEIEKKARIVPVLTERVDALETLSERKYGSKAEFLELKQALIEEEQDLLVQNARYKQLAASIKATENQLDSLLLEQRRTNLTELQAMKLQVSGLQQEVIKAETRVKHHKLVSPIDGQVQQLAIHTVGGVVTPAQPLMVIVPDSSELEVEAFILNKDIGFVHEGQGAAIKIDTFNFTKYGLINAEIITISDDAIQDEHLGLVYSARLKLKKEGLQIGERWVNLSPGMSVVSEIKTGQRKLIEYFLSPLLKYRQESIRER